MEKYSCHHCHCCQSRQLFLPQYNAFSQTILTLTNISTCTTFETSDIYILTCCSRPYRSSLNFAVYMFRCRSLKHPLYIYAAMILNNPFMMFWGWCINIGCCHPSPNGCLIIGSFTCKFN